MVRGGTPAAAELIELLRPYSESHLLSVLENNRIALYTKVLQMQYEAVAHGDDAERLAETITTQRHQIERMQAELNTVGDRHAAEVDELRREQDRLRELLNNRFRPRAAATIRRVARAAINQSRKR
jgi:hypothetical protein